MKQIFLLLFLLPLFSFSQEPLTYSDVIQVDSISQTELYYRAKLWFANTYKNSKEVIHVDNQEAGQILGKSIMDYTPNFFSGQGMVAGTVKYTITIYVKEGRYKYEITDFIHHSHKSFAFGLITDSESAPKKVPLNNQKFADKVWNDIKSEVDEYCLLLISEIKTGMEKPTASENDDW